MKLALALAALVAVAPVYAKQKKQAPKPTISVEDQAWNSKPSNAEEGNEAPTVRLRKSVPQQRVQTTTTSGKPFIPRKPGTWINIPGINEKVMLVSETATTQVVKFRDGTTLTSQTGGDIPEYARKGLELSKQTGRAVISGGGDLAHIGLSESQIKGVGKNKKPIHLGSSRRNIKRDRRR